ncbi:MAG: DAK2 domain-containing protein [Eubacteriales bacterium]|nr:DAK2 domain-containing protein [Eubacteriales bacterium]
MAVLKITGEMLRRMFTTGAQYLETRKQEINQLNVFPVPDGDTGTNMSMTAMSSCREMDAADAAQASQMALALAKGALKGARGNSGVILSQLFRGFAKGVDGNAEIDALTLGLAMNTSVDMAYKSVMKPREGTILSVSRAMGAGAMQAAGQTDDVIEVLRVALQYGQEALRRTPEQLEVLKKAGVVDAGGKGLLVIYEGCLAALEGRDLQLAAAQVQTAVHSEMGEMAMFDGEEEITFGYCTEFFIIDLKEGVGEAAALHFRDQLDSFGDSVVVVYDDDLIKVHVHSETPDRVLGMALELGALDNLKIENMRRQHREMLGLAAAQQAAQGAPPPKELGMVAVAAGSGLTAIFRDIMVDAFVEGGQTMNPSAADIAQAIRQANAKTVFVLPNNSNIIMAAQQAADLVDCDVRVIPSKSIPQCISAALSYNPDGDADEIEHSMISALGAVKSGQVTYAVRDTQMDGLTIQEGNIMGISAGKIQCAGEDLDETVRQLVRAMAQDGCEMISLYYGEGVQEQAAEALKHSLAQEFGDCDVEVYHGGQPVYYYLVSVE